MVGRVPQVSFSHKKSAGFLQNDSPLARGRLQNAKMKEQVRTRIISELPVLSHNTGKRARLFSQH